MVTLAMTSVPKSPQVDLFFLVDLSRNDPSVAPGSFLSRTAR